MQDNITLGIQKKKLPKKTKIAKTRGKKKKNPRPNTSQRNPTVNRHQNARTRPGGGGTYL